MQQRIGRAMQTLRSILDGSIILTGCILSIPRVLQEGITQHPGFPGAKLENSSRLDVRYVTSGQGPCRSFCCKTN